MICSPFCLWFVYQTCKVSSNLVLQIDLIGKATFNATCLGIVFLTEKYTQSSVIISLVWLWLRPADLHAHL